MKNITVIESVRTIELTKTFATKASHYGTEEYKMLQEVRRDYPGFKVITRTVKSKTTYKGLTYDYMEAYIKTHDDEKKTRMNAYIEKRGMKRDEAELMDGNTYQIVKDWFLGEYPDIEKMYDARVKEQEANRKKREEERKAKAKKEREARIAFLLSKENDKRR